MRHDIDSWTKLMKTKMMLGSVTPLGVKQAFTS
jgi:hypothetical protein